MALNSKTKLPFVDWIWPVVHVAGVGLFIWIAIEMRVSGAKFTGAGVYVAMLIGANYIFANNHWRGRSLYSQQKFDEALGYFEQDFNTFTHAPHIEQLLFPLAFWYREKDLFHMAMCLNHVNDRNKAKTIHNEIKQHIPDTVQSYWAYELIARFASIDSKENVQRFASQVQNVSKK